MNYFKLPLVVLLSICVSGLLAIVPATAQQTTALERGYRTGYSDGYTAGFKDVNDHAQRNYQNKEDYQRADRSFNDVWGPIEDYRDGYQQGFEAGYTAGFDRSIRRFPQDCADAAQLPLRITQAPLRLTTTTNHRRMRMQQLHQTDL
jgi:flagellar biosynthesis/type III secretory pathway protein FliH